MSKGFQARSWILSAQFEAAVDATVLALAGEYRSSSTGSFRGAEGTAPQSGRAAWE